MGYIGANFSLPGPFCSRLKPNVRDRQATDRHQMSDTHHCLMPPLCGGRGIITVS